MGKIIRKKAIIFDMDGVISDTQKIHSELEEALLREHGIEMTAQELERDYAGIPDRECAEIIFKKHDKEVNLDKFVENKWLSIVEFGKGKVFEVEGAIDLINKLKESNFRLAIASSSMPGFIDLVLSELKVRDKFEILTNGQEVKNGKPNPDIFLLTAKKLGVSPKDCVVIEDAKHGVMAAKRAGMRCIWLTNYGSEEDGVSADVIVKNLKEIKLEELL